MSRVVTPGSFASYDPDAPAPPGVAAPSASVAAGSRVVAIDVVRGIVMVLMAIDHVRVFAGVPAGGPDPGVFLTRWVTHFCAPAFVFLAGTSAYLYGARAGAKDLTRFLVTRGALLVLLELTVLRFAWTFNFDYRSFTFLGVIWMLGACMILMAALVRLPVRAIAVVGVLLIALHDLVGPRLFPSGDDAAPGLLSGILYTGGVHQAGPVQVAVLFVIVPWIGVMAAGYAFGAIMRLEPERRRRICVRLGLALTAAFVLLRALDGYGDPRPWHTAPPEMPVWIAFLNTTKYPASLSFLLMTLGPTILASGLLDAPRTRVARWMETFGRVPFFFYVLHIPLIHLLAMAVSYARTPESTSWLVANHPYMPPPAPDGYRWSLLLLYAVWLLAVALLYVACRWYAARKGRGDAPRWMRFV